MTYIDQLVVEAIVRALHPLLLSPEERAAAPGASFLAQVVTWLLLLAGFLLPLVVLVAMQRGCQ